MKATIDIPDDLYRRVKAKSALLGRAVREVTIELYRRWLDESSSPGDKKRPEESLREWIALADQAVSEAPPGPTARDMLAEDRHRGERG
jgi:hypothetical protein